ncbi:hypothetical protein J3Q64DRAFT_1825810 [Phycomyces blakesleeanus]|uniref:Uncharacterized protein n=2 Tax=Phycomyces blakesleeanus TaxID=4837 RepID=A0A162XB80_PHYB8|nr:hypothetical protein PHYBLDRAFT_168091 [Phycomyces blakesleeanus NRRL 1555(-)]XP_018291698.1 hypothetical protein PHYBLDRAFT_168093 [Phycomyces blakesleeanus NRRL 1555(-)]OAD73655.1 hypothetical protein PHYBLDRAFT_168091 [Phycomyces blakesleeanus NRRL 1555(-)]OAD73658.1 hypothetical protein PHYBLDRAFT_168093 [Phycomyces blakesleeanus NRRL 1555(-)]|eukprot:XP_018291695.1 hypothetical protein PHYBLDRAFT_168091 [Phycomyces blakesleeanus NRRL 1555(-)]
MDYRSWIIDYYFWLWFCGSGFLAVFSDRCQTSDTMAPCLCPKNGNKVKKKHPFFTFTPHNPHSTMQILSIQKRIISKCQRRQSSTTNTASRVSTFTSSMGQCIKGLASVKKAFSCKKVQTTAAPSLISSSSTISNDSYLSDLSDDEHFSKSCPVSEKSMALDSLIFDHPSVTVRISPAAYRSS